MPFDEPLVLPPTARVEASAAIELMWLVIACRKRTATHAIASEFADEVDAFWGDGYPMFCEMLVVAYQLGCLTGWNIEPLLSLSSAEIDATTDMNLQSEVELERTLVRERIARLAGDAKLRARYERLLGAVWSDAEPVLRELGRPTVERAVVAMCASMEHGRPALDVIGDDHIASREPYRRLAEQALHDRTLVITPSFVAGRGHGHIVALPGLLSVAVGTGVTTDMARNRATAERIARDLTLLSDPTRVLILTELERAPATVGEIARRVGIAQPTASVHVRQLRDAGLVTATREGASSTYRVERSRLQEALRGAHDALLPELTPTGS
jgi:DNA-binding transcriptional ArsR family regulator